MWRPSHRWSTGIRGNSRKGGCSSSVRRRPASRLPMRSVGPAARSPWLSASTCAVHATIGAGIFIGGWKPPACSTSAMTRSTTSCGPAACRRCSSRARPNGQPSISTRSRASASSSSVVSPVSGTAARNSPDPCATSANSPISSSAACSTPSTSGRRPTGSTTPRLPPHRFEPTAVPGSPPLDLDLTRGEIQTIIWASGYRPDYSWLDLPVLDRKGLIRHDGGVVESPGMYLIGAPFLRRRKSSFIDGARSRRAGSRP